MSTNEITAKVSKLKRLQTKADDLNAEIKAIQNEIKAELEAKCLPVKLEPMPMPTS